MVGTLAAILGRIWPAALLAVFLLSPANAAVPGDGRPIALVMCATQNDAELFVAQVVAGKPRMFMACIALNPPVFPTLELMAKSKLVFGPLEDWEGDAFGVFEAPASDGTKVFPVIWWGRGFSPIGLKV